MKDKYIFNVEKTWNESDVKQVSKALEQITEQRSRKECPKLWAYTDKINERNKMQKRSVIRTRIWSIVCIGLGVFLIVPGLMQPEELKAVLFAGAIAIGAGVGGLKRASKNKKIVFADAAEKLKKQISESIGKYSVEFIDVNMQIKGKRECEDVPYDEIECIIEMESGFAVIFNERILVLFKSDMEVNDGKFDEFIKERCELYTTTALER